MGVRLNEVKVCNRCGCEPCLCQVLMKVKWAPANEKEKLEHELKKFVCVPAA